MYQTVELYEEPRKEIFSKLNISEKPEMSEFDSAFLGGRLKKFPPAKNRPVAKAGGGYYSYHYAVHVPVRSAI